MLPISTMKRRHLAIPALLIVLILLIIVQLASHRIVAPRRPFLSDFHTEILRKPAEHGLVLREYRTSEDMPYLLCRPGPRPSPKGVLLREQLRQRGHTVSSTAHRTVLILHGHGGRKEDSLPIAERFCALGYHCLLPDLPGHGANPDPIATFGKREVPLLLALCRQAIPQHQLPADISLLGFSQGGAIALQLAADPQTQVSFAALTAFSTFANLGEAVARQAHQSPLLAAILPLVKFNLHLRYDLKLADISPQKEAAQIQIPTLIVHGEQDQIAHLSDAKAIYEHLASSSKRLLIVPEAGHSDTLLKGHELYAEMAVFFLTKTPPLESRALKVVGSQGVEP